MARKDYTYIGKGKVYFKEAGASAGLIEMGNVTKLAFGIELDVVAQLNYQAPGGGKLAEVERVKDMTIAMTLGELKPANIALLLRGAASAVNSGTATAEAVTAYKGALARLAHASPSSVVVKNEAGNTTYDVGDDYEVRPGGIFVTADSAIGNGDVIKVDYAYGAEDVIQALVASGKEYELFFEGLNEAQSGAAFLVDAWRVHLGAAKAFDLISDAFASYEVTGSVLADTTKTGVGESQFFKATGVQ